jgi:colanic acid biosynthesis glycosyl transferase WcaI
MVDGVVRILIVTTNYHPELTGIGKFNGEMAAWLARRGHEVRVITAPPYYPEWDVAAGYSAWKFSRERLDGVDVIRCPLYVPRKPRCVTRLLHLLSFSLSSLPVTLWNGAFWRPDLVFVLEPPLMCAPAALLAKLMAGGKSWLHVQDFEVDAAFQLGIVRGRRARSFAEKFESWMLKRFDRVSTISGKMLQKLGSKGVDRKKIMLFPNWVDHRSIFPLNRPGRFRSQLNIGEDKIVLLYSGNMGEKQGLEVVVEAAKKLRDDPKYLFVFCGQGAARERLETDARRLTNVVFMDLQPVNLLNELLNSADIHLLPQRPDAEDLVMPSKLTAMLASGKPVIAAARMETEVATLVSQCGVVVEPADVDALCEAISELGVQAELRSVLGKAGREYAVACLGIERILETAFTTEKVKGVSVLAPGHR